MADQHSWNAKAHSYDPHRGFEIIFYSHHSKLTLYDDLKDVPVSLELILWKTKIIEQFEKSNETVHAVDMKGQCCTDSLSMVAIIVPNVLSFLTNGNDGNDGACCGDNDGDDNSDDDGDSLDSDENVEDDSFGGGGDMDDMNVDDDI